MVKGNTRSLDLDSAGSCQRWREAVGGGREQSEVEGSDQKCRGAIRGAEERFEVKKSDQRWKEAIRD